jgi:tetratricopeptide (TPR) repeat protein
MLIVSRVLPAFVVSLPALESFGAAETAEEMCERGALHLEAGDLSLALDAYTRAIGTTPGSSCGYLGAGRVYQRLDEPLQAIDVLKQGLERFPASVDLRLDLAALLADLQRFDSAAEHYETVLADERHRASALVGLGILHSKKGDFARAREALRGALEIDPRGFAARYNLGVVLTREGDLAGALDELSKALEIDERQAMAHYARAGCLEKLGSLEDARAALQRALELDPALAPAHYRLGPIDLRLGRTEEGQASLRRYRQLKAGVHYQRGEMLRGRNDRTGAIRAYERSLDAYPALVDAHARLGLLYLEERDGARALLHARQAAQLDPSGARLANVAWIYRRGGRKTEALAWIDRALEKEPGREEFLQLRGRILQMTNSE